ncbi:MAG: ATP-binding protein [Candidatus Aminicenantes bacterium]|nr:ATP-binding protein [Candidatus Aminicenantes bacterium]
MHGFIERHLEDKIVAALRVNPAVALLGPRQCGKSTLAGKLAERLPGFLYLDLESDADLNKLNQPELFFQHNADRLVCLDEIQRMPRLFPVLRSVLDRRGKNGQLLLLGSASPDLINRSSESLAGRIAYLELTPFLAGEVIGPGRGMINKYWLRGGYPRSFLAKSENDSFAWRENFIRTFVEKDIPQLGIRVPGPSLKRLWRMGAHFHGQILNFSKLGESLGLSYHTIQNYIDLLEQTFIFRVLRPYHANLKKRLVKAPKLYFRDSGLWHCLSGIRGFNDLMGHPMFGASWEGMGMENILAEFPGWDGYFYRSASGTEIDLVLEKGRKKAAVEFKASSAPVVGDGFRRALEELQINEAYVVAPVPEPYPLWKNVQVLSIADFIRMFSASGRDE